MNLFIYLSFCRSPKISRLFRHLAPGLLDLRLGAFGNLETLELGGKIHLAPGKYLDLAAVAGRHQADLAQGLRRNDEIKRCQARLRGGKIFQIQNKSPVAHRLVPESALFGDAYDKIALRRADASSGAGALSLDAAAGKGTALASAADALRLPSLRFDYLV